MPYRLLLLLLLCTGSALAQTADQTVLSAVDSPDPVIPGQNLTYTVVVRNNGPDLAVNGGLNVNLGANLTLVSTSAPPGFSCFVQGANISCIHPQFAPSTTASFTIVTTVGAHLLNFPDGSIASSFFTSGTTPDPVPGNNSVGTSTSWDSPQVDLAIAVSDAPDPVGPDQDITYSVVASNAGPDTASAVNFNVFNNGTLRFRSATAPPGFNCTLPVVGGVPTFTCSAATVPPGNYPFSVVVRAELAVLGPSDGTVQSAFSFGGTGNDVNQNNNAQTVSTAYVTPDADMAISVVDAPDPAIVGGSITYVVSMSNSGPDSAGNATLNVFNNGTLRFQSALVAPGFQCTLPAIGAAPAFTCTNPSFGSGQSAEFTVTVRADAAAVGINGGTVATVFSAGSALTDPNNGNNVETEQTVVIPDQLFRNGFEG